MPAHLKPYGKYVIGFVSFLGFVSTVFAVISFYLTWIRVPPKSDYGSCHWKPREIANVQRVQEYLEQAMSYIRQERMDLGLEQLHQILVIDPNFLAVNLDVGSAYLKQGQYKEAQSALEKELATIDCLSSVPKDDLKRFSYLVDPSGSASQWSTQARNTFYQERLTKTEDTVHYNLACVRLKENDIDGALQQVRLAVTHGSFSREMFQDDPDLKELQESPAFAEAISRCPSIQ